ncbi:MAG: DUF308 domain-containing protein [Clostridia bacterium]|nr:DUF308 domain-containing protein [Clostridia bacterium]
MKNVHGLEKHRPDTIREARVAYVVASALFFIAGILFIIFPQIPDGILRWIFGIGLCLIAATRIFAYWSNDLYRLAFQYDFAFGIFTAVLGLLLMVNFEYIMSHLQLMMGMYILLDGLFKMQIAIDAQRFGMSKWWILLISSLVVVVLTVPLIFGLIPVDELRLVGIAMALDGAENSWNTMYTVRVRAKKENKEELYGELDRIESPLDTIRKRRGKKQ